jgi:hypothetical protein
MPAKSFDDCNDVLSSANSPCRGTARRCAAGLRPLIPRLLLPAGHTRRSTIIFLISAIALAGFNPFGQVLVQFMIVWHR